MANKTLLTFVGLNLLFALSGVLLLVVPLLVQSRTSSSSTTTPQMSYVAADILLQHCPLVGSMANAAVVFIVFIVALQALILPRNRVLLQCYTALLCVCVLWTLSLGLVVWISTLKTRANFAPVWAEQSTYVQSMLQYKLQCCGYNDSSGGGDGSGVVSSAFIQDTTCTSVTVAASLGDCAGPFSNYANSFLDLVFTALFGLAALDFILLLSVLCLLKQREERERYLRIDEKDGYRDLPM